MAQDHSVLGLQLLFSFLSSSSGSPKWCVHECGVDLVIGLYFLGIFPPPPLLQEIFYDSGLDILHINPQIGI